MARTTEQKRNRWRGMAFVGKYPNRDDMFDLLDDADECERLESLKDGLMQLERMNIEPFTTAEVLSANGDYVRWLDIKVLLERGEDHG